jgi:hypothetical protein
MRGKDIRTDPGEAAATTNNANALAVLSFDLMPLMDGTYFARITWAIPVEWSSATKVR